MRGHQCSSNPLLIFSISTIFDPNIKIDHIDSDPLNNTKINLRKSDYQKNGQNKRKRKNSLSKYIGIGYHQILQFSKKITYVNRAI